MIKDECQALAFKGHCEAVACSVDIMWQSRPPPEFTGPMRPMILAMPLPVLTGSVVFGRSVRNVELVSGSFYVQPLRSLCALFVKTHYICVHYCVYTL